MYLGYLGYKTANVPTRNGIDPPSALFEIDQTKVVGLTIEAERLAEIRQEAHAASGRQRQVRGARRDLRGARLCGGRPPHVSVIVDMTDLGIEETAARIIQLVERRQAEVRA